MDTIAALPLLMMIAVASPSQDSPPAGFNCFFRSSMCEWKNFHSKRNMDDFNWKWGPGRKKATITNEKGFRGDHTGDGGGYAYISSTRTNRTALLRSPTVYSSDWPCFQFYYHMNGDDIGHLAVRLWSWTYRNLSEPIWKLNSHQDTKWNFAQVPLPCNERVQIVFEGFDWQGGVSGTVAVDDVAIKPVHTCTTIPPQASPEPPRRRQGRPVDVTEDSHKTPAPWSVTDSHPPTTHTTTTTSPTTTTTATTTTTTTTTPTTTTTSTTTTTTTTTTAATKPTTTTTSATAEPTIRVAETTTTIAEEVGTGKSNLMMVVYVAAGLALLAGAIFATVKCSERLRRRRTMRNGGNASSVAMSSLPNGDKKRKEETTATNYSKLCDNDD